MTSDRGSVPDPSALQRLYGKAAGGLLVNQLEDFTTEALRLAIIEDYRPFVRLLEGISDWEVDSGRPTDLAAVDSVRVWTQQPVGAHGIGHAGVLDLVVEFYVGPKHSETAWVEVKVDAPEGPGLKNYLWNRTKEPTPTFLITLTRSGTLNPAVTGVSWASLVDCVTAKPTERCTHWWPDLVDFLHYKNIVPRPLPRPTPDNPTPAVEDLRPIFRAVNEVIKLEWSPMSPWPLHYRTPASLTSMLKWQWRNTHRICVTGGPITYGLRPVAATWQWWISVGVGSDFKNVYAEPGEVLQAADEAGLPQGWVRADDPRELLSLSVPYEPGGPATPIIQWFSEAIRQLRDHGVLTPYHDAYGRKHGQPSDPTLTDPKGDVTPA